MPCRLCLCLVRSALGPPSLGDPLVDEYLRFTGARVRRNTVLAPQFDLKVFFRSWANLPSR